MTAARCHGSRRRLAVKVQARLATLFISALSQSMPVDLMQKVARVVIEGYDIYERSGFPAAIPMPRADAARHILKDFVGEGYFLKLVEALLEMTSRGDMGRDVKIPLLPRIVAEIEDQGYRYSPEKGVFVEAGGRERTMGWGTLREGRTYEFALLRFDIAGNSGLVRRYPRALVTAAYDDVRNLVTTLVEKRDGRVWDIEGDGGLAAFYFADKTIQATLCGMELIHELFLYNLLDRELPEPVLLRLAVHAGPCRLTSSAKESAGDTIRRVELLESGYTCPGCLTVSPGVFTDLGSKLSPLFAPVAGPDNGNVFRYGLAWEKR
jgi:class 3 adenylate cyclase